MSDQDLIFVRVDDDLPGYSAAVVIDDQFADDVAKTVVEWIKDGANARIVSTDEARRGMAEYLRARKEQAA